MRNLFRGAFESVANAFLGAAGRDTAASYGSGRGHSNERGRIEKLCGQIGWSVDERLSSGSIVLHFNDSLGATRNVFIDAGDEALVSFTVYSFAIVPAQEIRQQVIGFLLQRNKEVAIGAWQVSIDENDENEKAFFRVVYRALGAGLTAESFKYIGERMVGEAAAFDKRMQAAGLLESS